MPLAYWPGSSTEKRLKEIAKRMRAKVATDFSGVILKGTNILYRRGAAYIQKRRSKKYPRWNWKKPFGKPADWRLVDYVLLHGPEIGQADEAFFLFTVEEAENFYREWRNGLNVPADPISVPRDNRNLILEHQRTLREVIRTVA